MHEWQAHDHLVLASIMTVHREKRIFVTGGNDNCVAVWDVGDNSNEAQKLTSRDNGEEIIHCALYFD